MKTIILIILFASGLWGQNLLLFGDDAWVYAGDYNGTDEYLSKTTPVNLDLNDTNRVVLDIDNDFEPVLFYQSDFSAGTDGHGPTRGTLTGNVDGIYGEDNVLRFYGTSEVNQHSIYTSSLDQVVGNRYAKSIRYYIPAQNDTLTQIKAWTNEDWGTADWLDVIGAWTTYTSTGTVVTTGLTRYQGYNDASIANISCADDSFYIKDISIHQVPSWTGNGNHSIDTTSTTALTGTYSGMIVSTGVGDVDSCASLPAANFTALEHGKKYTFQMEAQSTDSGSVTLAIGDSSWSLGVINDDASAVYVKNFEWDTTGNPTPDIKLYSSQPDTIFIDEVDISEAYDATMQGWFNQGASATAFIVGNRSTAATTKGWAYYLATSGDFVVYIDDSLGNKIQDIYNTNLAFSTWHHWANTFDRTGYSKIYINGALTDSIDITAFGTVRSYHPLNVGLFPTTANYYFNGYIGETQIVRGYALTAAEILANYNLGIKGKPMQSSYLGGDIISWWKFAGNDDATFLQDEQGNNDLTGTNMTQADDQVKLKKYAD